MASSKHPTDSLTLPNKKDAGYQKRRKETDLREPYQFPLEALQETKKGQVVYDIAESPLIAFINGKSGGRVGPQLVQTLHLALGNAQVFDLSTDRPDAVIKKIYENFDRMEKAGDPRVTEIKKRMKIVACGGDGTVTWVLKVIKDLQLNPPPAIAIIPLGTGNDLSRTYLWGKSFEKRWIKNPSAVYNRLKLMSDGHYQELDSWKIDIRAPKADYFEDLPHVLKHSNDQKTAVTGAAWNYISIGMDAQSAYRFHHLRENHPALAFSRAANQFWYSFFGIRAGWFCCCNSLNPPVNRSLSLEILTKEDVWTTIELPNAVKAVVLVNLQSYAGGRNIWGKSRLSQKEQDRGLASPDLNDGLFEVCGFRSGYHTGFVMLGMLHTIRLGQGKAARIKAFRAKTDPAGETEYIYMQIDGEPWKQRIPTKEGEVLNVDVIHNGRSSMLFNNRMGTTQETSAGPSSSAPEAATTKEVTETRQ